MSPVAVAKREDWDTVFLDDTRSRPDGKCFYCVAALGSAHKDNCVIRRSGGHYMVAIRHNGSGVVRMWRHDLGWHDDDEFMWTEGNYSCDCNRYLFFERAIGGTPGFDQECGDTAFSALYAELPDGQHIPLDEEVMKS